MPSALMQLSIRVSFCCVAETRSDVLDRDGAADADGVGAEEDDLGGTEGATCLS